jgi:WD40 repeat protein
VPVSEDDVAQQPTAGKINSRLRMAFILASVHALLVATRATATTIDTSPYPTLLLPGSKQFLVRDSWNGVALYQLSDLGLVYRFRAGSEVRKFTASSDGNVLILVCDDDSLSAFDLSTGRRYWEMTSSQSGLIHIRDISISYNGQTLLVCLRSGDCLVFESATGRRIGTVPCPDAVSGVCAAALAPDGTRGIFLGDDEQLYAFDVASRQVTKTGAAKLGLRGQAAYSVDGKYVALYPFPDDFGPLVVVAADSWTVRNIGGPSRLGHLKPTADGGFLLTMFDTEEYSVGLRWRSGAGDLEELWKLPNIICKRGIMDFDPEKLIGVFTDFQFHTWVLDLRTGEISGFINNSANYRARIASRYSPGIIGLVRHWLGWDAESSWTPVLRGAVVLGGVAALWLVIRRRRQGGRG